MAEEAGGNLRVADQQARVPWMERPLFSVLPDNFICMDDFFLKKEEVGITQAGEARFKLPPCITSPSGDSPPKDFIPVLNQPTAGHQLSQL